MIDPLLTQVAEQVARTLSIDHSSAQLLWALVGSWKRPGVLLVVDGSDGLPTAIEDGEHPARLVRRERKGGNLLLVELLGMLQLDVEGAFGKA